MQTACEYWLEQQGVHGTSPGDTEAAVRGFLHTARGRYFRADHTAVAFTAQIHHQSSAFAIVDRTESGEEVITMILRSQDLV